MRQLSRPYLQHARRHSPGGSDPIPGVVGVSMIVANGNGTALTGGDNFIDLDAYLTSDENIYGIGFGTGGLSATHGVSIAQEGIYRASFRYWFTSGVNGDVLDGSYNGGAGPNLLWQFANSQKNDETEVVFAAGGLTVVDFSRLFVIGGSLEPLPEAALPRLVFAQTANHTGGGGGAYDVTAWILVERLGSSYTTNAVVPF